MCNVLVSLKYVYHDARSQNISSSCQYYNVRYDTVQSGNVTQDGASMLLEYEGVNLPGNTVS